MTDFDLYEPQKKTGPYDREANLEYLQKRQGWLRTNRDAINWLHEQGLSDKTIKDFNLGLSVRDLQGQGDALVAPVPNAAGIFTSCAVYLNIPSVTLNPKSLTCWMRGKPKTYYSAKDKVQTSLLVLSDLTDLWLTVQHLGEWNEWLNLLIICQTHVHEDESLPSAWQDVNFWRRFEHVYAGFANNLAGDQLALDVAGVAGREIHRLRLPFGRGRSWQEFWNKGGSVEDFHHLLTESVAVGAQPAESGTDSRRLGPVWQEPVDVTTAFHNGHLYYVIRRPSSSLQGFKDGFGNSSSEIAEKYVTEVIRSDRTIHTVRESPCPRGTPPSERVLRLSDGTLLESEPVVSPFSNWTPASVQAYIKKEVSARPLDVILSEIKNAIKQSVWLPFNYDYDLLTLLAPITFAQPIFKAVPMIYLTGASEGQRSALGRLMCSICCNGAYLADSSPGDIARLIHRARGFAFLNEFDFTGRQVRREFSLFRELSHALRISYNQESAIKLWVDSSTGASAEKLNLFGVKMFGVPQGTDEFPNSPMLRVALQEPPSDLRERYARAASKTSNKLKALREELHVWTFENVRLIDTAYRRLFPRPEDRDNDFTAPLKVFAELAGGTELTHGLVMALRVNKESVVDASNPIELMIQAAKNLIREGYDKISATHVSLEMKAILGRESYEQLGGEQVWENFGWIGRELRSFLVIEINAPEQRSWLRRKYLRVLPIRQRLINIVLAQNQNQTHLQKRQPFDFCTECADCRYRDLNCPIKKNRESSPKTSKASRKIGLLTSLRED